MYRMIKIVCVGPSPRVCGGMSRIIEMMRHGLPDHIQFRIVSTYSAYIGHDQPDSGPRIVQVALFLWALLQVLFAGVLSRSTLFHVHLSQQGSTLRKGLVCMLLRLLRCRYIVHGHGGDIPFHSWMPKPAKNLLLWGLGGAQYFIALTHAWSDYYAHLLKCGPDRIIVLPNPVELPISLPDRTNRKSVGILFLGRIGEHKGASVLIRSFAALPYPIRQHCRLTLAGDGDADGARALAERLGCAPQTSVRGWLGRKEVEQLLSNADIFVLPSKGEGMSAALLEAMAWGLAVVSSTAGGATEFLQQYQNSMLVEHGDVKGITAAIYELVQDGALRFQLGLNARKTASRFTLDKYIPKLTYLYEALARNGTCVTNETFCN